MTAFIEHSGKSTTTDPWLPGDEGRRRGQLWREQENLGESWKCSISSWLQDYMHLPKFTELYYKKVNRTLCKFTSINLTHTTPQKYLLARFECAARIQNHCFTSCPHRQMPSLNGFASRRSALTSHQSPLGTLSKLSAPSLIPVWSQATLMPLVCNVSPAWELLLKTRVFQEHFSWNS